MSTEEKLEGANISSVPETTNFAIDPNLEDALLILSQINNDPEGIVTDVVANNDNDSYDSVSGHLESLRIKLGEKKTFDEADIDILVSTIDQLEKLNTLPEDVRLKVYESIKPILRVTKDLPENVRDKMIRSMMTRSAVVYRHFGELYRQDVDFAENRSSAGDHHKDVFGLDRELEFQIREINHTQVVEHINKQIMPKGKIDIDDIDTLHMKSMRFVLPDYTLGLRHKMEERYGEIGRRSSNVKVGDKAAPLANVLDPRVRNFTNETDNLLIIEDNEEFEMQLAEMCGNFLAIHPFADANARTVLLLADVMKHLRSRTPMDNVFIRSFEDRMASIFSSSAARERFWEATDEYVEESTDLNYDTFYNQINHEYRRQKPSIRES